MESIASLDVEASSSSASCDYGFAFDDSNFSDRILRIEIMDGDIAVRPEEQIVRCNQPDDADGLNGDSDDEQCVAMIEEEPSDAEALIRNDSNWSVECSTIVRVKTIHISSPILAAKSPFFYKMFSNGMRESEQRHATLCIDASEEAALMELLNFMYSNTLSITTAPAILDVLMAADKFEVASCMRYCSRLLRKLPMTPESALLYLDLPSSISMGEAVLPLTEAAKQFLVTCYRDMTKYQQEVMELPLAGIEAVLSSDDLQVASEDAVYDFAVKWVRANYPKSEERREIFGSHLIRYIRFPLMTSRKLKKLLTCNDFDHDIASKLVLEALFYKAESAHQKRTLATEASVSNTRRFIERAYKYRPVRVMEFDVPRQQCIVYLDLTREECLNLFTSGRLYSQAFHLNGQGFFLSAHCNMDHQSSFHCFGLFLGMQDKGSVTFPVDYEFAARTKPSDEFTSKFKGNYTFTGGKAVGFRNMFSTPWSSFIAEESPFFINGILHLRADISIKL